MTIINEIKIPKDNADEEVLILKTPFNNSDKVSKAECILIIETSKTSIEIESTDEGFIEYLVKEEDTVPIGHVVIKIHDSPESIIEALNEPPTTSLKAKLPDKKITRGAKKLLMDHNINLDLINKPFIKESDVEDYLSSITKDNSMKDTSKINSISKSISRSKKIEIDYLSSVQSLGLTSTVTMNIDAPNFKDNNNNLLSDSKSLLPTIVKEISTILLDFPIFNSFYSNESIHFYKDINIGIAMDDDDGLKVLTLHNTNTLTVEDIHNSISEGVYKYIRKELKPNDITGSTFTISDLSQYGVESFLPLVNKDQAAILGISSIDEKLKRFNVSLTFDHRVSTGKEASIFLSSLRANIESLYNDF